SPLPVTSSSRYRPPSRRSMRARSMPSSSANSVSSIRGWGGPVLSTQAEGIPHRSVVATSLATRSVARTRSGRSVPISLLERKAARGGRFDDGRALAPWGVAAGKATRPAGAARGDRRALPGGRTRRRGPRPEAGPTRPAASVRPAPPPARPGQPEQVDAREREHGERRERGAVDPLAGPHATDARERQEPDRHHEPGPRR